MRVLQCLIYEQLQSIYYIRKLYGSARMLLWVVTRVPRAMWKRKH